MADRLELVIDSGPLRRAMLAGPRLLEEELEPVLGRAGLTVADTAKIKAPKAFTTLTNSINSTQPSPLETVVAPGVDYAEVVEKGTRPGARPPVQSMLDWIRVKGITPASDVMDEEDLAWYLSETIALRGTPAQPYMEPALQQHTPEISANVDQAIERALTRMGRVP